MEKCSKCESRNIAIANTSTGIYWYDCLSCGNEWEKDEDDY